MSSSYLEGNRLGGSIGGYELEKAIYGQRHPGMSAGSSRYNAGVLLLREGKGKAD